VTQFLWIPGKLPSLNEIIDARRRVWRVKGKPAGDAYTKLKAAWSQRIGLYASQQRFRRVDFAAFSYLCVEGDRRTDPSNRIAGAMKLIEDALQEAKLLAGDGWANVLAIETHWMLGEPVGVMVGCGEVAPTLVELTERWRKEGRAA
jgi:hypothetical protein